MKNAPGWLMVAAAFAVGAAVMPLSGQQTANQDVLSALLTEVRGLRLAMEQMSSAGARVQLAMGRLQLQEQRVNTLLRRLDTVREQRLGIEREVASLRDEAQQMEEASESGTNPEERKLAAARSRALMAAADQRAVDLQRLVAEEAEMSTGIAAEQGRWSEINKALEELERTLTRR